MKFESLLIVFLTIGVSAAAEAADKGGNGGNALICFDDPKIAEFLTTEEGPVSRAIPDRYLGHITSIETLDYVQAKTPKGFNRKPPALKEMIPGETPEQYAERILNRPELFRIRDSYEPKLVSDLIEAGKRSLIQITLLTDSAVIEAQDIRPLAKAKNGCVYSTVAIQRSIGGGARELSIDGRLFDHSKNSDLSRAILILHEYVLAADRLRNGNAIDSAESTEGVREFVAALVTENTTISQLIEIITRRNLFSMNLENMLALPEIEGAVERVFADLIANTNRLIKEVKKEFLVDAADSYSALPAWFRKEMTLENIFNDEQRMITKNKYPLGIGKWAVERSLNTRDQHRLDSLKGLKGKLISEAVDRYVSANSERYCTEMSLGVDRSFSGIDLDEPGIPDQIRLALCRKFQGKRLDYDGVHLPKATHDIRYNNWIVNLILRTYTYRPEDLIALSAKGVTLTNYTEQVRINPVLIRSMEGNSRTN